MSAHVRGILLPLRAKAPRENTNVFVGALGAGMTEYKE
jgi:hypothetical protein